MVISQEEQRRDAPPFCFIGLKTGQKSHRHAFDRCIGNATKSFTPTALCVCIDIKIGGGSQMFIELMVGIEGQDGKKIPLVDDVVLVDFE